MKSPCFLLLASITVSLVASCAPVRPSPSRFHYGLPREHSLTPASGAIKDPSGALPAQNIQTETEVRPRRTQPDTVETADEALNRAVRALGARPSAETHRAVAVQYLRLNITDLAADHLSAAVALDRRDAEAYDLRARLWRDWGFPGEGLGDAYRAAYFEPRSAASQNTL